MGYLKTAGQILKAVLLVAGVAYAAPLVVPLVILFVLVAD